MMAVQDIACPDCGEQRAIEKLGIDTYRCTACGTEFSRGDILSR